MDENPDRAHTEYPRTLDEEETVLPFSEDPASWNDLVRQEVLQSERLFMWDLGDEGPFESLRGVLAASTPQLGQWEPRNAGLIQLLHNFNECKPLSLTEKQMYRGTWDSNGYPAKNMGGI